MVIIIINGNRYYYIHRSTNHETLISTVYTTFIETLNSTNNATIETTLYTAFFSTIYTALLAAHQ
jgi:hypothetical protein